MARSFNKLSAAQAERLALLSEELGEAQQAIGKILRHGYRSRNPFRMDEGNNRDGLVRELGDIRFAVSLMEQNGDVSRFAIVARATEKAKTVSKYLHHNKIKTP